MPVTVPDGRPDVFYPYLAVEDTNPHFALDFQHPEGQVYRHATNLRQGDGVTIQPARVATVFLENAGKRFEPVRTHPLAGWSHMRHVWRLLQDEAPSLSALRGAWSELMERSDLWRGPNGAWLPGGKKTWLDLTKAVLAERLSITGAPLEALLEAAGDGTLAWAIEWHLSVLKEGLLR